MKNLSITNKIQNKIHTIRKQQVMLDRDLAALYGVETRRLKEQVRRNIERFPDNFMFALTDNEVDFMVSQFAIPSKQHLGGAKPYAFTEQGVAMLSAILKSDTAIKISVQIMNAFVQMRRFLSTNYLALDKFEQIDKKLLKHDEKFEQIFDAMSKNKLSKQGIFYDGQVFDAYIFASDLIKSAKQKIILIDNYIDETTLLLLSKRSKNTSAAIYSKNISTKLTLDLQKHNQQYPQINIKKFTKSHDRFLIIDTEIYHLGASLKDLGKKWFAFSKMRDFDLLSKINKL